MTKRRIWLFVAGCAIAMAATIVGVVLGAQAGSHSRQKRQMNAYMFNVSRDVATMRLDWESGDESRMQEAVSIASTLRDRLPTLSPPRAALGADAAIHRAVDAILAWQSDEEALHQAAVNNAQAGIAQIGSTIDPLGERYLQRQQASENAAGAHAALQSAGDKVRQDQTEATTALDDAHEELLQLIEAER